MFNKIMQSLTIVTFMVTCLPFAPSNVISLNHDTQIIEKLLNEDEQIDETETTEPEYYVEVIDNHITEDSLYSICKHVGNIYDLPPELLMAIAWNESGYRTNGVGSSGDSGLCQIIVKWNADRMDRLGVTDIMDPYNNILVCADLISELQSTEYGNDIRYVLMAYNMGQYNAKKHYVSGKISKYANKVIITMTELQAGSKI